MAFQASKPTPSGTPPSQTFPPIMNQVTPIYELLGAQVSNTCDEENSMGILESSTKEWGGLKVNRC